MDIFGLGDAAKHIGTPQSIAIRNPDCAAATYLISKVRRKMGNSRTIIRFNTTESLGDGMKTLLLLQVGPIAVTSANPTGEADTTHHNQVYAKLGNKVREMFAEMIIIQCGLQLHYSWSGGRSVV